MSDTPPPYVILCALELDETGDAALMEATRLALSRPGCELHVVHVLGSPLAAGLRGEADLFRARAARAPQELKVRVDRACAGLPLTVRARIREGEPAPQILREAAMLRADVIVVGSHRRRGLSRLIAGSVGERVLRGACCAVFVVGAAPAYPQAAHTNSRIG